jgi:predicted DNA-binding antitoxin AbrB/MazE fold protein
MQTVEAIYQGGVFKPLRELQLPENERVILTVQQQTSKEAALAWIKRVTEAQERFVAERGYLSGVTEDIAADRMRDA